MHSFILPALAILILAMEGCNGGGADTGSADRERAATSQLEVSPRHHEWTKIKTKTGRTVRAYVAYPQVNQPVLSVVVIHENRGLNDWARSVTDQVAAAGYVAIAPDLLSGTGPGGGGSDRYPSSDAARTGIYELPPGQVLDDLDATVSYARKLKATNDHVAMAGFCWGGGQTFRYASHNPDLAAAFVFYGPAPDAEAMKSVKAPVYGFYGGNDHRITAAVPDVQKISERSAKYILRVVLG